MKLKLCKYILEAHDKGFKNTVIHDDYNIIKNEEKIIEKALEAPLRQIVENAGMDGSVVLENVKKSDKNNGYDAYDDEYVNMFEKGIVEPTKVTRSALENAVSIASMILTTEAAVADIKEEKPEMPPQMPMGY